MSIKCKAYPRAGLVGNPSDGYFGKTISFTFDQFSAEVELTDGARGIQGDLDGQRLLLATVKRFHDYCRAAGVEIPDRIYALKYHSDIPRSVGLAGSSALIIACLRSLSTYYGVSIPKPLLANLALAVETKELGIPAGLQDRVAQVYEGLVFMDFDRAHMEKNSYGRYEELDPALLPPLYIAYQTRLSESSGVFHSNIRERWEQGDPEIVNAMKFWAQLAEDVRGHLLRGEKGKIGPLLNANFDMRRKIYRISEGNIQLVETARAAGATAKFPGSGGAIIGTYEGEKMYETLCEKLEKIGAKVIKPIVIKTTS